MQELYKPTYLKHLAKEYGFSPSKKYGQNYLISEGVVEKIIAAADVKKDDTIVEIGPGFGVLTFPLASRAKKVIAFEIEKKLQPYWEEKLKDRDDIQIIWGNALTNFQSSVLSLQSFKVVANLPYQITSHALRTILEAEHKPELVVVMVQKEVADRMVAKPGDMSLLSVSVQYYGEPRIVTRVSKGNFWPAPNVDSAVVSITVPRQFGGQARNDSTTHTYTDEQFFQVVKAGFANKRKQLWKNLSLGLHVDGELVKSVVKDVTGDEKVRAEELSVEMWRGIVDRLKTRE